MGGDPTATAGDLVVIGLLLLAVGPLLYRSRQDIAAALRGSGGAGGPLEQGLLVSAVLSYGFQLVNFGLSRSAAPRPPTTPPRSGQP